MAEYAITLPKRPDQGVVGYIRTDADDLVIAATADAISNFSPHIPFLPQVKECGVEATPVEEGEADFANGFHCAGGEWPRRSTGEPLHPWELRWVSGLLLHRFDGTTYHGMLDDPPHSDVVYELRRLTWVEGQPVDAEVWRGDEWRSAFDRLIKEMVFSFPPPDWRWLTEEQAHELQ